MSALDYMEPIRPSPDTAIEEYLFAIAVSDLRDRYVAPKEDVARRIELEIQRKTKCIPSLLAVEHAMGETKQIDRVFITADPKTFPNVTLNEINRISERLTAEGATRFEIAFHNTLMERNLWGDHILAAARYIT